MIVLSCVGVYIVEFVLVFLGHMHKLMVEVEKYNNSMKWVKGDAAKASNMKKSETLRHALEDSLERALLPPICAVIAFVDPHYNMELLQNDDPVTTQLWLSLFKLCGPLGLEFESIREPNSSVSTEENSCSMIWFWEKPDYSKSFPV